MIIYIYIIYYIYENADSFPSMHISTRGYANGPDFRSAICNIWNSWMVDGSYVYNKTAHTKKAENEREAETRPKVQSKRQRGTETHLVIILASTRHSAEQINNLIPNLCLDRVYWLLWLMPIQASYSNATRFKQLGLQHNCYRTAPSWLVYTSRSRYSGA